MEVGASMIELFLIITIALILFARVWSDR